MRKLERDLRRAFPDARIEVTGKKHLRVVLPSGRSVVTSSTPKCPFALRKVLADVRRKSRRESGPAVVGCLARKEGD